MSEAPIGPGPGEAGGFAGARGGQLVWRRIGAGVALLEALLIVGNSVAVALVVARDGVTGPAPVATAPGVVAEVGLYLLFALALAWMARGFIQGSQGVLTPFMLAQILGLAVTFPLAMGGGAAGVAGILVVLASVCGLIAWAQVVRHNLRGGAQ